jgi:hypothetical protein
MDRLPIAAEVDYVATPVSGYLGKEIYFTQVHKWGSFVVWNRERAVPITEPDLIASAKSLARQKHSPVLLLAAHPIDTSLYSGVTAKAHFDQTAVMQDEIYYLYIVSTS